MSIVCLPPQRKYTYISLISCTILALIPDSSAKPFINSTLFDGGYLGAYPYESFHTTDLVAPRLNIRQWSPTCDNHYILITPRANSVSRDGPMILNAKGDLIWTEHKYGTADNLQIQLYKGQPYLTFWAGEHHVTRRPGKYYMLDSTYQVKHIITPVGYEFGDLHEFMITADGTALMTVYDAIPWNLSPVGGPVNGWIEDPVIQEVDIETGRLLFEWRTSDHYDPSDSFAPVAEYGTSKENAFNWHHINSIDKDEKGNYFISNRLTCDIAYINATDGSLIWRFGGKQSAFRDLSEGAASNFTYQHHLRYHGQDEEDPTGSSIVVSVFDNGRFQRHRPVALESRGLLISLNLKAMTATLIQDFKNQLSTLSNSQGSLQVLKTDEVSARQAKKLVGWGHSAGWTTFGPSGNTLCEVHFGAYATWDLGWAVSYRVFQYDLDMWIGEPRYRPAIAAGITPVDSNTIYASWNGATAVKAWRLQGAGRWSNNLDSNDSAWEDVDDLPKDSFEVAFNLREEGRHMHHQRNSRRHEMHRNDDGKVYRYYRVQAIGDDSQVLAASPTVDLHTKEVMTARPAVNEPVVTDATISPILLACIGFSAILLACAFFLR